MIKTADIFLSFSDNESIKLLLLKYLQKLICEGNQHTLLIINLLQPLLDLYFYFKIFTLAQFLIWIIISAMAGLRIIQFLMENQCGELSPSWSNKIT